MTRMGVTFAEFPADDVTGDLELPPKQVRTDFYFKALPAPDGKGLDCDPSLVYCTREETVRWVKACEGELVLRDSQVRPGGRSAGALTRRGDRRRAQRHPTRTDPLDRPGGVDRPLHPPALRRPVPDRRGAERGVRGGGRRRDRRRRRHRPRDSSTRCSDRGADRGRRRRRGAGPRRRRRRARAPSARCAACAPTSPTSSRSSRSPTTSTPTRAGATCSSPTPG